MVPRMALKTIDPHKLQSNLWHDRMSYNACGAPAIPCAVMTGAVKEKHFEQKFNKNSQLKKN